MTVPGLTAATLAPAAATSLAPAAASPLADPLRATGPLQTTATGGSATLVLAVFAALFIATVLSLYLAARLYRGYRAGGGRAMLGLFVGLVLLTTVPILARLVLTNVGGVPATTRTLVATASQLLGLLVVLGVVYDRG